MTPAGGVEAALGGLVKLYTRDMVAAYQQLEQSCTIRRWPETREVDWIAKFRPMRGGKPGSLYMVSSANVIEKHKASGIFRWHSIHGGYAVRCLLYVAYCALLTVHDLLCALVPSIHLYKRAGR